jgi:hypothetical protein
MDAPSTSRSFGETMSFNEQFNFDIPLFEDRIVATCKCFEKRLDQLEGYFSFNNFTNNEKITFAPLKMSSHVKHWWEVLE